MKPSRSKVIAATKGALRGAQTLPIRVFKKKFFEASDAQSERQRELKARLKRARTATVKPKGRLPNGMFDAEAVRSAKRVRTIKRPGARRVIERDTGETGEIIGVHPGGFVKVKWDGRQRPTMIKRSEMRRHKLRMNPGLMELAGGVQALEYLAGKAGVEGFRKRKRRNPSTSTSSDVRSPTRTSTSTRAKTTGNITVTGGAGRGATTSVTIRRNPSGSVREMSERFQGRATGRTQEYYASNAAPRLNFSRAGQLVFLKLKGKTIKVSGAVVAIDPKTEKLWIAGSKKQGIFQKKAAKGELLDYGPVDAICYLTAKAHIGAGKRFEYVHAFGEEGGRKPRLLVDDEGMPILRGGSYKIEDRGIVN